MQTKTRIVGSGFSVFRYNGKAIAFLDEVHDSGQQPIRQYEAVTPLDAPYPLEFALPRVRSEGKIDLVIRELWAYPVWWGLAGLTGTGNIIDVYNAMANTANPITCTTLVMKNTVNNSSNTSNVELSSGSGNQLAGQNQAYRGWTYNQCVVTAIDDREAIQIGTLTFPRNISLVYAYKTFLNLDGATGPS